MNAQTNLEKPHLPAGELFHFLRATAPPEVGIIGAASFFETRDNARQQLMIHLKAHKLLVYLALVVSAQACASLQPPNAGGPRANEAPYPVMLAEDNHRTEATIAAVNHLMHSEVATVATPPLQPVTATIESLPANTASNVYLTKLGAHPVMNEEETREALRRFIRDWQGPIGAEPAKLSLVDRVDLPDGSKSARYEQRAFRYPVRGNYGKLEIRFTPERRVLNIISTCIPDAEKIQTALAAVAIKLKAEDALTALAANDIQYTNADGTRLNFRLIANNKLEPHELVTYITPAASQPNGLEFHVAWEVGVVHAPFQMVYIDAVTGQVVGTQR